MVSPEIEAYLEVAKEWEFQAYHNALEGNALALAEIARVKALLAVIPARLVPLFDNEEYDEDAGTSYETDHAVTVLADEFVYFPILVEQLGGDREAAENAWALGQRPAGYPKDS